jgi:hypothetical protein
MTSPHKKNRKPHKKKSLRNAMTTSHEYRILCVFAFEKLNLSKKLPLNVYFNAKFLLFLCYKRFLSS